MARAKSKGADAGDAELLLVHVLKRERSWLIAHAEDPVAREDTACFEALVERRVGGEPIAYLTGEAWFYGRRFEVTPAVLVPRPETEHLIDEALAFLRAFCRERPARRPVVLDVGTGSGAIACTIAAEVPNALVYATERSPAALEVAQRNANARCRPERRENVTSREVEKPPRSSLHIELADLLPRDATLRFDCVIANLPYVPTADVPRAPDPVSFEPREAVDGGPDGLREYRRLLEVLPKRMNAGGLVVLEAAPPTIAALRDLVSAAFPKATVRVGADYAGLRRFVCASTELARHA